MEGFQVPLDLPQVKILSTRTRDNGDFEIEIESTKPDAKCPKCNKRLDKLHSVAEPRRIRHMDILGRKCFLILRPKRFLCPNCNGGKGRTVTQRLSWIRPKSTMTRARENWLMRSLVDGTVRAVANLNGDSEQTLHTLVKQLVSTEPDWKDFKRLETLGIDEIALRKGRNKDAFVTIISCRNGKQTDVLMIVEGREKDAVVKALRKIPKRLRKTVKTVTTDMHKSYTGAAKEVFPGKHVVDRFHVAKKLGEAVDKIRKSELKRLKAELSKEEYEEIKGTMWLVRDLKAKPEDHPRLKRLLELSPALARARELRLEATRIFDRVETVHGGKSLLGRWLGKVAQSELKQLERFARTLRNHWEGICRYFEAGVTSGFVEGLNTKIRWLTRRCFGIASSETLMRRLKLDLRGYARFG